MSINFIIMIINVFIISIVMNISINVISMIIIIDERILVDKCL
jgi:hypothetical protein